ncbi:SDR family NAD(P)-dependent oxidoreductase [Roseobacter sp.]|uniref:SDR family NAD(P)-dependent oxidoreductase n=1 Tax=Roseobacter sp. TaxID=1907202 RepID=UPI00385EEB88
MKKVLIIGASGGVGRAVATACEARGDRVARLSRRDDGFEITDETSVDAHLSALKDTFDFVLIATGALEIEGAAPEKSIKSLTAKAMLDQFAVNALGPALVLRHASDLLPRNSPSIVAVISARVGSIGDNRMGGWVSYRSAKAAVNQIVHTTAIELARTHKQTACVALHPGTVATPFTQKYLGRHPSVSPQEAAQNLLTVVDGLGPDQTGRFFDWAGVEVPW